MNQREPGWNINTHDLEPYEAGTKIHTAPDIVSDITYMMVHPSSSGPFPALPVRGYSLEILDCHGVGRFKVDGVPTFSMGKNGQAEPCGNQEEFSKWAAETRKMLTFFLEARKQTPESSVWIVRNELSLSLITACGLQGLIYDPKDPKIMSALSLERAASQFAREQTWPRRQVANHPWYGRHRKGRR